MKVTVKPGIQENFIGFYEHLRRRPGDVFSIRDQPRRALFKGEERIVATEEGQRVYDAIKDKDGKIPQDFSFRWMEPVAANTPDKVSTAQQNMDRRSADIKAEKAGQRALDEGGGNQGVDVI